MRVRILTRLKNGPEIIDTGTEFEGTEETLPDFVLYELKRNRGAVEILPDLDRKKKKVRKTNPKPPVEPEAEAPPKGKPVSLREKLNTPEK